MGEVDSETLFRLLNKNSETAFEWLYKNYASSLYGFVIVLSPKVEIANLIFQKSFENIWVNIRCYEPENCELFIWMLRITLDQSSDILAISKTVLLQILKETN